MLLYNC